MNKPNNKVKVGREKAEEIRDAAMRREIGAFDLMEQTTQVVRSIVKDEFLRYAPQTGMAVFVHGSPSRNEMSTYSDIDILFVETIPSIVAGKNILKALDAYGFGKVDEQGWRQEAVIERYAKHSLVDGNKVFDAQFIAGDPSILSWMSDLQTRENTLDRAMKNVVFQRYYLEHYYSNRSTEEMPNVKYQQGGTRDLLTYDWFDNTMALHRGSNWVREPESNRPKMESSLKNMNSNGVLSSTEYETAKVAVEFTSLLRNEILHVNQNTKDKGITHLDTATQERVLASSPAFFSAYGANTPSELRGVHEMHRKVIYGTKMHLWQTLLLEEEKQKGSTWRKLFDAAEKGELSTLSEDPLINVATVWGLHHTGNKKQFNVVAKQAKWDWEVYASIACSNLASPEVLEGIRSYCQPVPEQGYILRIIGRNPNAREETITKIAEDNSLGIYSIVAKKRIEEGLDAAIKRCS